MNTEWKTARGTKVVLVEPDMPWYINIKTPPEGILTVSKKKGFKNPPENNYAKFDSKFVMDPTRPDMGYGYSLKDRLGEPCAHNQTEHFNSGARYQWWVILFIIILCYKSIK